MRADGEESTASPTARLQLVEVLPQAADEGVELRVAAVVRLELRVHLADLRRDFEG